jgi:lysyl-tRNA synthetase, class II
MTAPLDDSSASSTETESMYEAARREKMRRIVALGHDPWGSRFDDRLLVGDIRALVSQIEFVKASGEHVPLTVAPTDPNFRQWVADQGAGEMHGPKVRAAGRIVLQRDTGKLIFIDIQDWTGKIQLFIGRKQVGDAAWALAECFDLGDLIGVDGQLRYTKTGELTIFAENLHFLTKAIASPPDKHAGLSDPELRHRMRYVDLTYTEGVLERFLQRTKIVQSVRQTLGQQGFVEIEGPTLHTIAGGAAARPFKTHHNALDMQLFMRIALELHLKRLLVGGMERVYELVPNITQSLPCWRFTKPMVTTTA